jgi:trimethylamine---corrinoid protein Co-methyltransferase
MAKLKVECLSVRELKDIQDASLEILRTVGVVVHHAEVLKVLEASGAKVDWSRKLARFDETLVMRAIEQAGKQFAFHGYQPDKQARFGAGDANLISSPGQYAWFDYKTSERREPVLQDAISATRVGAALPNISIVGAMSVPMDIHPAIRDVVLMAEMVKICDKPVRCWPVSRRSSHYVLEILSTLAGGKAALREKPMVDTFLEPISPLQLPETGLDIMLEFLDYGQPISIGPMAMVSGTGPATLAGTLAQENAEILAGIVAIQVLSPGTPVIYGGIPHIMDPRTSICSFGSPEQGLMATALTELGKSYGFPVYINVNLTDAKVLDVQAGMEKMGSFILGMLAGAELFGHAGIVGTDHGGNLAWLVIDNEAYNYARRVQRGFDVDEESLALSVVNKVGPAGNYLSHPHTVRHYRKELWIPNPLWTRESYGVWAEHQDGDMAKRAIAQVDQILAAPVEKIIDRPMEQEIDRIVDAARRELT